MIILTQPSLCSFYSYTSPTNLYINISIQQNGVNPHPHAATYGHSGSYDTTFPHDSGRVQRAMNTKNRQLQQYNHARVVHSEKTGGNLGNLDVHEFDIYGDDNDEESEYSCYR